MQFCAFRVSCLFPRFSEVVHCADQSLKSRGCGFLFGVLGFVVVRFCSRQLMTGHHKFVRKIGGGAGSRINQPSTRTKYVTTAKCLHKCHACPCNFAEQSRNAKAGIRAKCATTVW